MADILEESRERVKERKREREKRRPRRLKRILVHGDSYLCRKSSSRVLFSFFSVCLRKGDIILRRALGNTTGDQLNAYCRAVDFFVRAVLYLSSERRKLATGLVNGKLVFRSEHRAGSRTG